MGVKVKPSEVGVWVSKEPYNNKGWGKILTNRENIRPKNLVGLTFNDIKVFRGRGWGTRNQTKKSKTVVYGKDMTSKNFVWDVKVSSKVSRWIDVINKDKSSQHSVTFNESSFDRYQSQPKLKEQYLTGTIKNARPKTLVDGKNIYSKVNQFWYKN